MVCYARREEATLVTPPLHAPPLQLLWPRKYAPTQISHSYLRDLRAVQRSNVYDNLWRGKWLRPSATFCNFFVNTTGGGGLNGSTQHSILKGKDGVFGNASRLFSRLYGIRENRALGSLAAGRVAESDWASVW